MAFPTAVNAQITDAVTGDGTQEETRDQGEKNESGENGEAGEEG